MTTGVPIYLVSACTSGEEFVAAFRRYADRNGLFIPIAVPIPAGRRGRFAVTLKDGGVMIEGDADIVSSATTPSVLHGRVGMTLRFIEPDIKSKTVLVELEQARLAMKPQPPSVPPRPAQIPAEPRPKVPTLAGRIDANNALAECVVIGNVDALEATVPQVQKAGPKFVVPSIPPVAGVRPKSPSTPPMGYPEKKPAPPARPQTPSTPPPLAGLPPSIPLKPARAPAPAPAPAPAVTPMSITTIDAPIITPSITPMSITTVDAPIVTPTGMAAAKPSVTQGWDASDVDDTGDESEEAEPPRDTVAMPAIDPGEAVAALARSRTASDELTAVPQAREAEVFQIAVPRGSDSDTFPAVQVSSITKDAVPEPLPDSASKSSGNSARMGLPPPRRTSGNTQPPPARHPTPSAPLPVVGRTSTKLGVNAPRAATQLGLPIVQLKTPAQPSGGVPLPPVVAEEKPKPLELSDEPTDITGVPVVAEISDSASLSASAPVVEPIPPSPSRPVPGGMRKTVMGIAVVPEGVTVLPASPSSPITKPTEEAIDVPEAPPNIEVNLDATPEPVPANVEPKLPGQRPPVIEEPSGDWTMIPGEAGPTILPRKPEPPAAGNKLPTGDWTIARVEDSPDGWSEPAKVDERAPIVRTIPMRANTGPPVAMVAGEKPLEVTMTAKAFDIEEETKSGLKVEVDSSLGIERQTSSADFSLASTQFAVPQPPLGALTPPPGTLAPVVMPPPMSAHGMAPMARVPSQGSGSFPDFQGPTRGSQPADLFGSSALSESTSMLDRGRKKRIIIIAASAGAAIVLGIVLLIAFGFGGDPKKPEPTGGSSARVVEPAAPDAGVTDLAVKDPIVVDAGALATEPDAALAAITPPDKGSGECFVEVSSTPSGAEILRGKEVVGTTPAKLAMPCGVEVKLVVRKAKLASSSRTVMPTAAGAKLRVALGKTLLSVKVTSSPPGASITLAGKSLGVTPAVVKLPAMESATLVIGKTGFNSDSQKITPKQNNQSVHVTLKKKPR